MSDLISRQAAIDALKDVSEHYTDKGREWHPHVDFMVEAIQDLPSAQPQITHCAECIHWKHSDVRKNYCEVFDWTNKAKDFCSFAERREE